MTVQHPKILGKTITLQEARKASEDNPLTRLALDFLDELFATTAKPASVVFNSATNLPSGVSKRTFLRVAREIGTKRGRTWYVTEAAWLEASAPKARRRGATSASKQSATSIQATLAKAGLRIRDGGAE
ncbi:MAG: hypothetical protein ACHREM_06685 [Polyangiales bacterium]